MQALRRSVSAGRVLAVVLVAALAIGCDPYEPAPGTKVGDAALDFTLSDGDGNPHSLSDYAGDIVWIQFLNVSSSFCLQEAEESMAAFYDVYASQGISILAVLVGNNAEGHPVGAADATAWASQYGLAYPVLYDSWDGGPWAEYREPLDDHSFYVPLNVIVTRDGVIWYKSKKTEGYNKGGIRNVFAFLLAQ